MSPLDSPALRAKNAGKRADIRADLLLIADMIEPGSRVLDVGCGDGVLLDYLIHFRQVTGRGLELSQEGVNACVSHGLSVIQGDADLDLADYPDGTFDYVVLSRTLQATQNPREVLEHLVRIGTRAVVSFPNFGYWRIRWALLTRGRMPVTRSLPDPWWETPNIHLCTIRDFLELCEAGGIAIERALTIGADNRAEPIGSMRRANLLGQDGLFLLRRADR
ncbi:methionine biosynthesis protein MetW [Tistlia consotensis]|uniref:Methionine biosynthesis protein MetW n=1 Tax=Tistlia consotensis USBA 355 TaxID=560819 RepID=A0A1Y6B4N8_9PROT|nr:methionine biosynthesis protein MetW [Tistlia consotensis]SME91793.1 methionine biosynthesis protein MetW [Tistlia consotensis USBA 355]SNR27631.1 methionine biosynthesis protein MetW [Tistlia consotensis]